MRNIWRFPKSWGISQFAGWFIMENPSINGWELGVPLFQETSIWGCHSVSPIQWWIIIFSFGVAVSCHQCAKFADTHRCLLFSKAQHGRLTGSWLGTFFIFPYIGNNSRQLTNMFQRGRSTTNQIHSDSSWFMHHFEKESIYQQPAASPQENMVKFGKVLGEGSHRYEHLDGGPFNVAFLHCGWRPGWKCVMGIWQRTSATWMMIEWNIWVIEWNMMVIWFPTNSDLMRLNCGHNVEV